MAQEPIYTAGLAFQSFRRGEEKGFNDVFTGSYASLCYYANRYVKDKDAAEDIVQDCFIKLWQRHSNFNTLAQVKSYLYKVVRFACLDFLKQQARDSMRQAEEAVEEPVIHQLIRNETWSQLFHLVETLPPAVARVIKMLYIEGKTIKETADTLHKSIYTIKSQRAKGLAILRSRKDGLFLVVFIMLVQVFTII